MIKSIPRGTIVDMLLNSLEAERYVRVPLLLTLLDELGEGDHGAAAARARDLLVALQARPLDDGEYLRRLGVIRSLSRSVPSAA